jgi:hypothetical protein
MKHVPVITLIAFALTACTSAKPIMAPSGVSGFKVWCEMPSQCYTKAAQVCPNGYKIEADVKDYWGAGDVDGNLIIVCKPPSTPVALPASGG